MRSPIAPEKAMPRNQINVTLSEEALARVDQAVARYFKRDRSTIMREMFEIYFDRYLEAEEARRAVIDRQLTHEGSLAKGEAKKR